MEEKIIELLKIANLYKITAREIFEIFLLIVLVYYILKNIRGTRMWIVAKGIFIFFGFYAIISLLKLNVIQYILNIIISFMAIALIIVFQPEIRKSLESLGTKDFSNALNLFHKKKKKRFLNKTMKEIVKAVYAMAEVKTGALIAIEKNIPLEEYINSGIPINADISQQLIMNIFEHNTPLHDGAMVIRGNKIIAATCYFPLSEDGNIKKNFGTRHRSAIGLSELVDALVIVVSEETGAVSVAKNGKLYHNLTEEELYEFLVEIQKYNSDVNINELKEKRFFTKTKIISAFLGLILWCVLTGVINPVIKTTFEDVPVTVINDNVITDSNKTYEIQTGKTVDIEVTGKRSIINNLSEDDLKAEANFSKISISNAVPIIASTKLPSDIEVQIIGNDVMTVAIDDTIEMETKLIIEQYGTTNEYYYTELTPEQETVVIRGPKSIIKTIDKAVLTFNVEEDHEEPAISTIDVYDKNGDKIDKKKYTLSEEEIAISFKKLPTKRIPIKIIPYDEERTYETNNLTMSFDEVTIAGNNYNFKILNELEIRLDISGNETNKINSIIKLTNYIPEDMYLVTDEELEVQFEIDKYITKTISIPKDKIQIQTNKEVTITDESISLNVTYEKSIINVENEINVIINTEDLEPGTYTIQPTINTSDTITIEKIPSINIEIKERE